jgi:hypothetical protein
MLYICVETTKTGIILYDKKLFKISGVGLEISTCMPISASLPLAPGFGMVSECHYAE